MKLFILSLLLFILGLTTSTYAQNISIISLGGGTTFIPPKIKKAGDDFKNNKAKKKLKAKIKISFPNQFTQYFQYWTVEVRREDILWDNRLSIWVKRKGNLPGVYYGSYFRKIHTCDDFFFNGSGSKNNIPLEFELRGLSVLIPVNTYETEITFTVLDY